MMVLLILAITTAVLIIALRQTVKNDGLGHRPLPHHRYDTVRDPYQFPNRYV